ncbi:MAG: PAS domain-containing protein, partial [Candidatus Sumerlaeota bacterium]
MNPERANTADELRNRAEAMLSKSPETFEPGDIQDINKLAHELAVHQAELEVQNEELQNTQAALQETRDRFAVLFEDAPVGYVVLDDSGIIRQTNATWGKMLGRAEEDFRGQAFAETLVEEDAPLFLSR